MNKSRKLSAAAGAALVVAAVAAPLVGASPADAATNPRCMSRSEFRQIHRGMTPAFVAMIVGSRGVVSSSYASDGYVSVTREYRVCTDRRYGVAWVDFGRDDYGQPVLSTGKSVIW